MSDSENLTWTSAEIFKARILDAWEKYPPDADASQLIIDVGDLIDGFGGMSRTAKGWVLSEDSLDFLDQARRDGVL